MFTADRIEERAALKQLNEAGRSVYPKPKRDDSKLNLIFRLFSSDRTKITQVKDRDGELPMMTGSFFGTGMDQAIKLHNKAGGDSGLFYIPIKEAVLVLGQINCKCAILLFAVGILCQTVW